MAHKQHIGLGVLYAILAALSFSAMSVLGKVIGDGASTDIILFARFSISLVLILPWIIKDPKQLLVTQPVQLLTRSFFTLSAFFCFFYALKYISLADALLLNNSYPLFIPFAAYFIHKAPTPHRVWIGILLGFIGVALVLKPDANFFKSASLIGLLAGIFAAIAGVLIRGLTKQFSTVQILFYNFFFCTLITGLILPFTWQSLSTDVLLLLLGVGILGASYQLFSTFAIAKAPIRLTASLTYLCIVFGVIADFFIWKNVPDNLDIIGMVCVICGGILTILLGRKLVKSKMPEEE